MPEKALDAQLDRVVETAVNQVGVNVNTASPELLTHISGLTTTTVQNIVTFRNDHGAFANRQTLNAVPRLGPLRRTNKRSASYVSSTVVSPWITRIFIRKAMWSRDNSLRKWGPRLKRWERPTYNNRSVN